MRNCALTLPISHELSFVVEATVHRASMEPLGKYSLTAQYQMWQISRGRGCPAYQLAPPDVPSQRHDRRSAVSSVGTLVVTSSIILSHLETV